MRVGIIGRTGTLLKSADAIRAQGHQIAFVLTCKSEFFYDKKENNFKDYAKLIGVPFFNTLDLSSISKELISFNADICISINWLTLIPKSFLSIFPFGILNAHSGDLPRYKGNACPNWAILNFESKIGLTIHKITEELDSGPYLLKRYLNINEETYIKDIYTWIESIVPSMFVNALDLLLTNGLIEQDKTLRTLRTYPRKPQDSRINWSDTRRSILANIRASSHPFDGAFCFLNDTDSRVVIYRASKHEIDFDFLAIPGQVCLSVNGQPVISAPDGLILLEEFSIDGCSNAESNSLIIKSLRNRLC